jgi:hypothetical protein
MKRIHALEWEDLSWFPKSWRDFGTDYLRFIAIKFNAYKPILPLIKKGINKSGQATWVDCASGGGSGLIGLANELKLDMPSLKIILTDYFPNIKAFEQTKDQSSGIIDFETNPVNAIDLPKHLQGNFRTIFGAFHHFKPDEARSILQNVVDTNSSIGIFEPVSRNIPSLFAVSFTILNVLLFTPFIRPVRWIILPFIYLFPIIPLYIMWDGFASILRTYSEDELRDLISSLKNADGYEWEIGKTEGPMPISYLLGYKK